MRTTTFALVMLAAGCGGGDNGNNANDMAMAISPDMATGGGGVDMAGTSACNALSQNCPDPSMPKCTYTITGTGMSAMVNFVCTADGTVARDQACTIDVTTTLDNCQKGLICTGTGAVNATMCRKICANDNDCGGTQKCARSRISSSFGLCIPTCTEFGTTCGTGGTCANSSTDISSTTGNTVRFLTCRAIGTGMPGDACSRSMPCGENMLCIGSGGGAATAQCSPLCDSSGSHNCPTLPGVPDGGTQWTCMPVTGISGVSACQ